MPFASGKNVIDIRKLRARISKCNPGSRVLGLRVFGNFGKNGPFADFFERKKRDAK
jgi:hypothetical protein